MLNPLPAFKLGLEAVEIEHEGKPMILLRDQEGLLENPLAISPGAFFIAMLLDGKNDLSAIQTEYTKATGALLSPGDAQNIINQFEKLELLETPVVVEKRRKMWDDYLKNPIRPARFKGGVYPKEPLDIAVQLGKYFKDSKGPQKELVSTPVDSKPYLGLVSPHIDFERGGPLYAWSYQALSAVPKPDIVLALGVAHTSPNSPWVMTKKEFETPYGPMKIHESLYSDIAKSLWYDPEEDTATHRLEHSLEFQAVWLKYLYRDNTPPWVPILCSSFDRFCPDRAPSEIPTMETAIHSMGQALNKLVKAGQKVLILSGVDMSHVGPRFGDQIELNPETREKIEKEDRASLDLFLKGDIDAFYLSVVKEDHWRKWCGLSALYTMGRLLKIMNDDKFPQTNLLSYSQADDKLGGVVSFASATFQ